MANSAPSAPKYAAPRIGSLECDGDTAIEVGSCHRKYYIDKAVLIQDSEFFAKALQGPWREAREGLVRLHDVEPWVFNFYTFWLVHKKIPYPKDRDQWDAIVGITYPTMTETILSRLKVYAFADRILAHRFRNQIQHYVYALLGWIRVTPRDMLEINTWAFENLPANCRILQFLVNESVDLWNCGYEAGPRVGAISTYEGGPYHTQEDQAVLHEMPDTFIKRLILRAYEGRKHSFPTHPDTCYFQHVSVEALMACAKSYHILYDAKDDYGYVRPKPKALKGTPGVVDWFTYVWGRTRV